MDARGFLHDCNNRFIGEMAIRQCPRLLGSRLAKVGYSSAILSFVKEEKIVFVTAAISLLVIQSANVDRYPPAPEGRNYIVFPIQTELQRNVFFDKKSKFFVIFNGSAVVSESGMIKPKALDLSGLIEEVVVGVFLETNATFWGEIEYERQTTKEACSLLEFAIRGVVQPHYKKINVCTVFSGGDKWKAASKVTGSLLLDSKNKTTEDAISNSLVSAYPVNCALSRLCSNNADCVVVFKKRYGPEWNGSLSNDEVKSAAQFVKQLDLPKKSKIQFTLNFNGDFEILSKFLKLEGKELAQRLNFSDWTVSQIPWNKE